jgi:DNA-directed RNA polymerase subunit RPC12/RpoP
MPTTGKYSMKKYKCRTCGYEHLIGTNHWGECYSCGGYNKCPSCGWKHPMEVTIWDCQEPAPEGYSKPKPWKIAKLGDICKIKEI